MRAKLALQLGVGWQKRKRISESMARHYESRMLPLKRRLREFRVSPDALLPVAEAHGVVFLPGTRCGYEAQFGGHARLCFAMEERDLLVEGAKRLGAATRELLAADFGRR